MWTSTTTTLTVYSVLFKPFSLVLLRTYKFCEGFLLFSFLSTSQLNIPSHWIPRLSNLISSSWLSCFSSLYGPPFPLQFVRVSCFNKEGHSDTGLTETPWKNSSMKYSYRQLWVCNTNFTWSGSAYSVRVCKDCGGRSFLSAFWEKEGEVRKYC